MPQELTFLMGKYEATFPTDRVYAANHVWLLPIEGEYHWYRVGLTAYSVRLLLDVYFLAWNLPAGSEITDRQELGEIESSKAVSSLYAPAAGTLVAYNIALLDNPAAINADTYGSGWMYEIRSSAEFLSPQRYIDFLASGWDATQRMLKGQVNRV